MPHIPEGGGGFAPMDASPLHHSAFGSVPGSPAQQALTLGGSQLSQMIMQARLAAPVVPNYTPSYLTYTP